MNNFLLFSTRYLIIGGITVLGALSILGSGTTPPKPIPTIIQKDYNTKEHNYEITVVDSFNKPVKNAKVAYKAFDIINHKDVLKTNGIEVLQSHKDEVGHNLNVFRYKVVAIPDNSYTTWVDYKTKLILEVAADSYYSKIITLQSDYGTLQKATSAAPEKDISTNNGVVKAVVKLDSINDYFGPGLLILNKNYELKQKIYNFVDDIKIQSYLSDVYLKKHSIDLSQFKGNKYVKFEFNSEIVYNSLKLNKYDIAKTLFDEVIRKMLNPLNDHIYDVRLFYGYDLIVVGKTKDFSGRTATTKQIVYRFYIPGNVAKSYKEKDITGQQLIDKSIVLMDDERIDLKLQ